MNAIELLQYQVRDAYDWLEMTLDGISEEQANWRPPGTANCIGAVYSHTMIAADFGLSAQIHGRSPLIAAAHNGRIGLSEPMPVGRDWDSWAQRVRVDWATLRRYGRDVRTRVEEYVASATEQQLNMSIDMTPAGLGFWKGLDLFNLHGINHIRIHGGEIACLKGLQGGRGWSQGPVYRDD